MGLKSYSRLMYEAEKSGNPSRIYSTFDSFCKKINYKQISSHRNERVINLHPESGYWRAVEVTKCVHYSMKDTDRSKDGEGLVFEICYNGFRQSLLQRSGLRRSGLNVDYLLYFAYGERWKGVEVPTPDCFKRELDVLPKKLTQLSFRDLVEQYAKTEERTIKLPVKKKDH